MLSSGMLRRVTLVRTDVSEESFVSIIKVITIGELGTTLAAPSDQNTPRRNNIILLIVFVYCTTPHRTAPYYTVLHYTMLGYALLG
jgi:hypothetical protein